jgi:hypothetical protein
VLSNDMLCCAVWRYAVLCCLNDMLWRYAVLCCLTTCCFVLCCVTICCVVLSTDMLCCAVWRYAVLCCVTICCVVICQGTVEWNWLLQQLMTEKTEKLVAQQCRVQHTTIEENIVQHSSAHRVEVSRGGVNWGVRKAEVLSDRTVFVRTVAGAVQEAVQSLGRQHAHIDMLHTDTATTTTAATGGAIVDYRGGVRCSRSTGYCRPRWMQRGQCETVKHSIRFDWLRVLTSALKNENQCITVWEWMYYTIRCVSLREEKWSEETTGHQNDPADSRYVTIIIIIGMTLWRTILVQN